MSLFDMNVGLAADGTTMDVPHALTTTWVAADVTPLVGLNSGTPLSCYA
jgi:hypothetical protein